MIEYNDKKEPLENILKEIEEGHINSIKGIRTYFYDNFKFFYSYKDLRIAIGEYKKEVTSQEHTYKVLVKYIAHTIFEKMDTKNI